MTSSSPIKKRSARRCLFGRPDPKKMSEYLESHLENIKQRQKEKWGFDFDLLCPLPGSSCAYDFIPLDIGSVPEYYRPKVLMTPVKCPPIEKSPSFSPEPALDSSMESSDQELRSQKPKNTKKRRATVQPQIKGIFFESFKRKYKFDAKAVDPVVPTSPGCVVPYAV